MTDETGELGLPKHQEEVARALRWLSNQKLSGHCGEENSEARSRRDVNDRIELLVAEVGRAAKVRALIDVYFASDNPLQSLAWKALTDGQLMTDEYLVAAIKEIING